MLIKKNITSVGAIAKEVDEVWKYMLLLRVQDECKGKAEADGNLKVTTLNVAMAIRDDCDV